MFWGPVRLWKPFFCAMEWHFFLSKLISDKVIASSWPLKTHFFGLKALDMIAARWWYNDWSKWVFERQDSNLPAPITQNFISGFTPMDDEAAIVLVNLAHATFSLPQIYPRKRRAWPSHFFWCWATCHHRRQSMELPPSKKLKAKKVDSFFGKDQWLEVWMQ